MKKTLCLLFMAALGKINTKCNIPQLVQMNRDMCLFIVTSFRTGHLSNSLLQQNHKLSSIPQLRRPSSITALRASRKMDVGTTGISNFGRDLLNHELLSASDEFQLSRQFKLGLQVKEHRKVMAAKFEREISDEELSHALGLSSKEHVNILIDRGKENKRALVKANMRLVFHISKYYRFRGVAYPDLVQEGECLVFISHYSFNDMIMFITV
jgi:DNA-directed RNA polymerase sigma subunit (sigma70/sigma32)